MIEEILNSIRQAEEKAEQIKLDADKQAEEILFNAGEEAEKISADFSSAAAEYRLNKQVQIKQQAEKDYKDILVDGKLPIVFHYLNLRVGKYAAVQDGVSTTKWEDVEGGTIETD